MTNDKSNGPVPTEGGLSSLWDDLLKWNDTALPFPTDKVFYEYFREMSERFPSKTALKFQTERISYDQLEHESNKFASALEQRGVLKGDLIAIALPRSVQLIIGLLGIMKAGAVYVPIDPEYPVQYIQFILQDSSAKILLHNDQFPIRESFPGTESLDVAEIFSRLNDYGNYQKPDIKGHDLAYVIYTSGTTGKPKGVAIEHYSLTNLLLSMQRRPGIEPSDILLGVTTISFDIAALELFLPLMTGATLILTDKVSTAEPHKLMRLLREENVTIMQATPSLWSLLIESGLSNTDNLKILCGGEPLNLQLSARLLDRCSELWNMYGPTETCIWSAVKKIEKEDTIVTLGKPISNTRIYILDNDLNFLGPGQAGEIYIGGYGLAREYLNQPDLSSARFIQDPFSKNGKDRLFRTGDLGHFLADGDILYLGRTDDQIKIDGHRIELGAIESVLNEAENVEQAIVKVFKDRAGLHKLAAYVLFAGSRNSKDDVLLIDLDPHIVRQLKQSIHQSLPAYMVPQVVTGISHVPLTPNGKVDKKRIPDPANTLNAAAPEPARTRTEKSLFEIWRTLFGHDNFGTADNFFDLGGNSLLAMRFSGMSKNNQDIDIPVTRLYRYPTISQLAASIDGYKQSEITKRTRTKSTANDIAVVGMSGRFPGANTIEEFWNSLLEGRENIRFFTDEELDPSIPESLRNNPAYIKARGVIEDPDKFDAGFFGIPGRIAEVMDPQQRILLEVAWEALETSGHLPGKYHGKIGVFAGSGSNSYFLNHIHPRPAIASALGHFQVSTLNDKDYIAMRIAYQLDLKGPAVSVYSSSSTSLLAIVQAAESLRQGSCDVALAGGISVHFPTNSGHLYEEGAMFSKDGHSRPFDSSATGTVFSDGAGLVVLKPLEAALSDNDTIYAVLKGVGSSNDGFLKASFTAPHADGQAESIRMAIADAGIDSSDVSYVEAHGTATPIGDPIEIEALTMVFGEESSGCLLGSVKGNIGHLTHAAGVAGFIKTCLSLYHKKIPASINFDRPNPLIDLVSGNFQVNSALREWSSEGRRVAGVSSFGMGGTNVHVILEEAPERQDIRRSDENTYLMTWSARDPESLNAYADKLLAFLKYNPQSDIKDVAYTLQQTRKDFVNRAFLAASTISELIDKLQRVPSQNINVGGSRSPELVFLFPGQGSQFSKMGLGLYEKEKAYRDSFDECADILKQFINVDIRQVIFQSSESDNSRYTQIALFVTEYAYARYLQSIGITPTALCGHSIGEFVAAHLAGIFSLADVLKVIYERSRLVSRIEQGSMLAVKATVQQIESLLPAGVDIAAVNAPDMLVLSGPSHDILSLSSDLQGAGVSSLPLNTTHAFHSRLMDQIVTEFGSFLVGIPLSRPRIPMVSTVTGKWLSEKEATDPAYWSRQIREPVLFSAAISTLISENILLMVETGPGNALSTFAKRQLIGLSGTAVPGLKNDNEYSSVIDVVGKLWINGAKPKWEIMYPVGGRKIPLPAYAFNKKRYWIDAIEPNLPNQISGSKQDVPGHPGSISTSTDESGVYSEKLREIFERSSGVDINGLDPNLNFIEIGLDSLLLTQLAITLKKELSVAVSFRQLNEELNTIGSLRKYISEKLSPEPNPIPISRGRDPNTANLELESILTDDERREFSKPFGASPRIEKIATHLNERQVRFLADFTERYTKKTRASKIYTAANRSHMADPRVVSGFRPATKELVYPIVAKRSKGSRLWDLDNNEYIDALNGFGSNMLGYQPPFLVNAISGQIEKGYEIGPQHELAADVCKLVCEFTGFDRAAICSTGSEAVMGTMRIARTVTGRSLIAAFSGSYHGIFDEVLVRGTKSFRSLPAAPGILPESVQNMLILDYGTDEALQVIRNRAHELAAVLVEPIQSRRPDFQPIDFLREVREITSKAGTVLIFDEVITGFRMHPGGAQHLFGIRADIASYGKVIGGGLPIGVIAGKTEFMNALDGGTWNYGDESIPEAGVTYFAGTFVRHPLALAAAKASLEYFKQQGPSLQESLNAKTKRLVSELNSFCVKNDIPLQVVGYSSLWRIKFTEEIPYSELLFTVMRDKGIHIIDGFPCFMTEAHTVQDINQIILTFRESVEELRKGGFLFSKVGNTSNFAVPANPHEQTPIAPRLGRDIDGNPAWFIEDPEQPGNYIQVSS